MQIRDLPADTPFFYRVGDGVDSWSLLYSFRTDVLPDQVFFPSLFFGRSPFAGSPVLSLTQRSPCPNVPIQTHNAYPARWAVFGDQGTTIPLGVSPALLSMHLCGIGSMHTHLSCGGWGMLGGCCDPSRAQDLQSRIKSSKTTTRNPFPPSWLLGT